MISVIIPIFNEEKILSENQLHFKNLSKHVELIFVDGGSVDRSIEIAESYGRVFRSKKGRAVQMNYGARSAKTDILFFLHADNTISSEALSSVENQIRKNGIIAGCLTQRIDKRGILYRFLEGHGNVRARITRVFYGDQGIFIRKDIFTKLNGFPEVPIMEDVLFTKRLRRLGKTVVLSDKIIASPRRWEKNGIMRTILLHNLLTVLFWLRVPLNKISQLYDDLR